MKNKYFIFPFCLMMIFLSCSKLEREKDVLELDKGSILINQEGGDDYIQVEANGEWHIQDIPEWLSLDPTSGVGISYVVLTATENNEPGRRKASLVFTHGKLSKTVEVEQLGWDEGEPFIKLSESTVNLPSAPTVKRVKLTTNRPWKLSENYYQWISVSPTSGEGSAEITITVNENRNPGSRHLYVHVIGEMMEKELYIEQLGLGDYNLIPSLPIFSYQKISYNPQQNAGRVLTNSLFINPEIKDKIYLGNLVSHNAQSNILIPEFTGYTFNPITISTSAAISGEVMKKLIPSAVEQATFARQVVEQLHYQGDMFVLGDNAVEFYNHKDLRAVGIVGLGVKLDEVVSGFSFAEKEMPRKYGLIYSYKHTFFTLDMDHPEKLIKEELKNEDHAVGVSYVSSVSYGRVGLLIVESDTDSRDVRQAINKVLNGKSLSSQENDLIAAADIYYVYFDEEKNVQTLKGNLEAVTAYRDAALKGADVIYPVELKLSDFIDHSQSTISFLFRAGE